MDTSKPVQYRRKQGRLEWHFMQECRKYPFVEFVEAENQADVQSSMVCPICKQKYNEANGLIDTRKPKAESKGFLSFVRSEIFGLS